MIIFKIGDQSAVGAARRAATHIALQMGFNESVTNNIAIVINELGSNLLKYGKSTGQLILGTLLEPAPSQLFILAMDQGPGITNLAEALRDGYSSSTSLGVGLGAIKRLSDFFQLYTSSKFGTVIYCQFNLPVAASDATISLGKQLQIGALCIPKLGEEKCGDAWATHADQQRLLVLAVDGLGHGPEAAEIARLAVDTFKNDCGRPASELLTVINQELRKTRGAAVALAEFNHHENQVRFVGIGNISARLTLPDDKKTRRMMGQDGITGFFQSRIKEELYPWPANALFIMHSDGLTSHWELERQTGLATRYPAIIAGALYRDFVRGYDDTTVLAMRRIT